MEQPIGTCSNCGGPVIVPSLSVDPAPYCRQCGARARHAYGPVIPMNPAPRPTPPELQKFLDRRDGK